MKYQNQNVLNTDAGYDYKTIQQDKFDIDSFLNNSGYTKFQISMILIVMFIFFVDGCEIILINVMIGSINEEMKFSIIETSLISSSIFLGFFIGSVISGYIVNKYGRVKPIRYSIYIIFFLSLITASANCFLILYTIRIISGIAIGIVINSCSILIAEIIPTQFRSFILNSLWVFYPIGIIYICIISSFIVKRNYFEWRKICIINSINSLISIIIVQFLYESPRFLIKTHKIYDAIMILDKIKCLSDEDRYKILKIENDIEDDMNFTINLLNLINTDNLMLSILLSFIWLISSIINYGLLYILPRIFENIQFGNKFESTQHMIIAMIIIFPCPILRGILSELKFIGRKLTIIIGLLGCIIACYLCIVNEENLYIFAGILKFSINITLGTMSVYTTEVFDLKTRGIALGFGNGIMRIGGVMTPIICECMDSLIVKGSFYFFGFASLLALICGLFISEETRGEPLERK